MPTRRGFYNLAAQASCKPRDPAPGSSPASSPHSAVTRILESDEECGRARPRFLPGQPRAKWVRQGRGRVSPAETDTVLSAAAPYGVVQGPNAALDHGELTARGFGLYSGLGPSCSTTKSPRGAASSFVTASHGRRRAHHARPRRITRPRQSRCAARLGICRRRPRPDAMWRRFAAGFARRLRRYGTGHTVRFASCCDSPPSAMWGARTYRDYGSVRDAKVLPAGRGGSPGRRSDAGV